MELTCETFSRGQGGMLLTRAILGQGSSDTHFGLDWVIVVGVV